MIESKSLWNQVVKAPPIANAPMIAIIIEAMPLLLFFAILAPLFRRIIKRLKSGVNYYRRKPVTARVLTNIQKEYIIEHRARGATLEVAHLVLWFYASFFL